MKTRLLSLKMGPVAFLIGFLLFAASESGQAKGGSGTTGPSTYRPAPVPSRGGTPTGELDEDGNLVAPNTLRGKYACLFGTWQFDAFPKGSAATAPEPAKSATTKQTDPKIAASLSETLQFTLTYDGEKFSGNPLGIQAEIFSSSLTTATPKGKVSFVTHHRLDGKNHKINWTGILNQGATEITEGTFTLAGGETGTFTAKKRLATAPSTQDR